MRSRWRCGWTAAPAAVLLGWAGSAWAQIGDPVDDFADPEFEPLVERAPPRGLAVQVGGGVTQFSTEAARDVAEVGGGWDVRLTYGTRSVVGLEAAYVGSAQPLSDVALPANAYLIGNGAEGAIRLNAPIDQGDWSVTPFALAGVGWKNYQPVDAGDATLLNGGDNVLTIPLGAGLAASYRGFLLDARLTYRPTMDDELFGDNADMHAWTAGAHIGREF